MQIATERADEEFIGSFCLDSTNLKFFMFIFFFNIEAKKKNGHNNANVFWTKEANLQCKFASFVLLAIHIRQGYLKSYFQFPQFF